MGISVGGLVISNSAAADAIAAASLGVDVVAGTSCVQTLTIGGAPTAGAASTFRLSFDGYTTVPIAWSATNATLLVAVDGALEALSSIGAGNVTTAAGSLTAGVGTITLTFAGDLAGRAVSAMTVADNSLAGAAPTVAVAITTPGADATIEAAAGGGGTIPGTNALATGADALACGLNTSAVGAQSLAHGDGTLAYGMAAYAGGAASKAGPATFPCTIAGAVVTIPDLDATNSLWSGSPLVLVDLTGGTGPTALVTEVVPSGGDAFADPDTVITLDEAIATDHTAGRVAMADYGGAYHAEGRGTLATGDAGHAEGQDTIATGDSGHAEGVSTLVSDFGGHAEGRGTVASAPYAHAEGYQAVAALMGGHAFASGMFAAQGDAQGGRVVMRRQTTGATPATLFLGDDGLGVTPDRRAVIRADTTAGFAIDLVARKTTDGTVGAFFRRSGLIANNAGTTALIGSVATVGTDINASGLAVAVTADNTADAIAITVTGLAATTIHWVAVVHVVEVG